MSEGVKQRIDKCLFFMRVVKSRTLAGKLVSSGKVRVNKDKVSSANYQVKLDDVLTITLERSVLVLRIVNFGERRGPYQEAKELYEDLSPPPVTKDEKHIRQMSAPSRDPGAGRPTKKEKRELDRFRYLS
ncbi:RNA-binding S4 domain-containing protein [Lentilitoribacter sp. Alg239-R112]|uniref:RNA-binding S4 domain-containing protein n=1 Tax=Lentilitoribacter sp. Alg239-R112 TaxID=2305987 RepID=UPI0013A6E3F3|nr:RNA-binding S4 domain-containing protein [Lentilitoribacter sp. Alg239-R112]